MTGALAETILDRARQAVVAMDARGRVTFWNPGAERIFGYGAQDAIGRTVAELIVPERLRRRHEAGLERVLASGEGAVLAPRRELPALRADGREVAVELLITAVRDGADWTFFAFAEEVAARERQERDQDRLVGDLRRALHGSERRFDAIVGALTDAVTIRDRGDRLLYANRAAIEHLGFESWEQLRDVPPSQIMADYLVLAADGRRIVMDDIPSVRILRGEAAEPLLIQTIHRGSGRRRWELLKSAPLHDEGGAVEATIMITQDVTEQKRAEQEAEFLAQAGALLASSLDTEQTLRNVAALAVPEIADWCAVDLVGERGERRRVAVAHPEPARLELAERMREYEPDMPNPAQGVGRVFATGESVLYADFGDMLEQVAVDERHLELLRSVGMRSVMVVPMRVGERTLGAMTLVTSDSQRRLDEFDVRLAEQVGARAAVAIENARLYSERSEVAHTLQQSLLPDELPAIPGYELAAIYAPAVTGSEVGGDFYDAWEIDGGWMIVIGDVTGKGVNAAALTSLVRHTLRAASAFERSPAALLSHVDRALRAQRTLSICTALCLRLDGGHATLAVGGHPLPLYLAAAGVEPVGAGGPLLGAFPEAAWEDATFEIAPGATVFTYTDGVTDAVGADGSRFGEGRLDAVLAQSGGRSAAGVVDALRRELQRFQTAAHADDTAVLVVHRLPTSPPAHGAVAPAGAAVALP